MMNIGRFALGVLGRAAQRAVPTIAKDVEAVAAKRSTSGAMSAMQRKLIAEASKDSIVGPRSLLPQVRSQGIGPRLTTRDPLGPVTGGAPRDYVNNDVRKFAERAGPQPLPRVAPQPYTRPADMGARFDNAALRRRVANRQSSNLIEKQAARDATASAPQFDPAQHPLSKVLPRNVQTLPHEQHFAPHGTPATGTERTAIERAMQKKVVNAKTNPPPTPETAGPGVQPMSVRQITNRTGGNPSYQPNRRGEGAIGPVMRSMHEATQNVYLQRGILKGRLNRYVSREATPTMNAETLSQRSLAPNTPKQATQNEILARAIQRRKKGAA